MAESTSGPAAAAATGAASGTDAALQSQELTLRALLESGAHF